MPRFFFHLYDDIVVRDDEGIELADENAARRAAVSGAREMICDQVKKGYLNLAHRLEVEDEAGGQVLVLPFADAIEIERGAAVPGT